MNSVPVGVDCALPALNKVWVFDLCGPAGFKVLGRDRHLSVSGRLPAGGRGQPV